MGWQAGLAIDVVLLAALTTVLGVIAGTIVLLTWLVKLLVRAAVGRWGAPPVLPVGTTVRHLDTDRTGVVVGTSTTNCRFRVEFDGDTRWFPPKKLTRVPLAQ